MTVEEVKRILRIQGNQDDEYFATMLPLIKDYVKKYCNNDFKNEDGETFYPGGVQIAIAKLCQYQMRESGVQSESLARHSITYGSIDEMPADIMNMLRPYKKVLFV